jgi:hypothetical protein
MVGRVFVGTFIVFVSSTIWFMAMCLSGKDDRTGSAVREGISTMRSELPGRMGRFTTAVGRQIRNPLERTQTDAEGSNSKIQMVMQVIMGMVITPGNNPYN